jgi:hypothetical protein
MNLAGVARGRLRLARNALLRRGRGSRSPARHPLLALALTLFLAALLFAGMRTLFRWIAEQGAGPEAAAGPLGLLLTLGLGGLLVFDVQEAIAVLLLDSDLELLRRAPLSPRQVFALKLVDALGRTSTMVVVLLLPALLAFATVYRPPAWGWVIVPLGIAALWAIPLGFGVAITLAFISRMPVRRVREGMAQVSTLILLLLWFANAFLLPRLAASDVPAPELIGRLNIDPRLAAFLPSTWAARALAAAARHEPGAAAVASLTLVVAAALALGLAAWSATHGLETAQARAAAPAAKRHAARRGRGEGRAGAALAAGPSHARAPGVRGAILRRDARLFFRDWTVLSDVLVSAALWMLFPLLGLARSGTAATLMARAMLVTLAVALGYEVASRSLPFEREAGAWRQLAPVSAGRWISAKLAGAAAIAVPILLLATGTLAVVFPIERADWLRIVALALPALVLALALGLWSGATFGNPRWTDPRAMLGVSGRLIALLMLAVQIAFWIGTGVVSRTLAGTRVPGADLWGPIVIGVLIAVIPCRLAVRRVRGMEWPG